MNIELRHVLWSQEQTEGYQNLMNNYKVEW